MTTKLERDLQTRVEQLQKALDDLKASTVTKERVALVAFEHGQNEGWCKPGINKALGDLGINTVREVVLSVLIPATLTFENIDEWYDEDEALTPQKATQKLLELVSNDDFADMELYDRDHAELMGHVSFRDPSEWEAREAEVDGNPVPLGPSSSASSTTVTGPAFTAAVAALSTTPNLVREGHNRAHYVRDSNHTRQSCLTVCGRLLYGARLVSPGAAPLCQRCVIVHASQTSRQNAG